MLDRLLDWIHEYFKPKTSDERSDNMLNLVLPFVANMLRDVVLDKAQSLSVETLQPHLDKLPPDVKKALDDAVDGDNSHGHRNLADLIKGS